MEDWLSLLHLVHCHLGLGVTSFTIGLPSVAKATVATSFQQLHSAARFRVGSQGSTKIGCLYERKSIARVNS